MKTLGLILFALAGCSAAQLELNDTVTYVDGAYCPDQNGNAGERFPWTRLIAGFVCCSDQGVPGGGQCQEGYSCMNVDSCTATPLPDNVGATKPTKRRGLR